MPTPPVDVQRTTIDGVATLWSDLGGDFTGVLVIGAGARDLTPATAGLHHLVEHLVMSRVGPVRIEHNASSSPTTIVFWATGTPDRVADFLNRVSSAAASLGDVTEAELAVNRATVVTEVGPAGLYAGRGPMSARWGAAGLGLADLGHAALLGLTVEDVREFAATWLVTGAARLALSGPPPSTLALQLPTGEPPRREAHPEPLPLPTPGITYTESGELSLSFLVDIDPPIRAVVGEAMRETLLRRLRRDAGRVYSVEIVTFLVDGTRSSWTLLTDPATPAAALDVLRTAVLTVRELGTAGPDPDVMEHVHEALEADMSLHESRKGWVLWVAEAEARGDVTPPPPWAQPVDRVGAEQVRDAVGSMLDSLLVTFPQHLVGDGDVFDALEKELDLTPRAPLPTYEGMSRREIMIDLAGGGVETGLGSALTSSRGTVHKGKFFGPARGLEIWLGPRQVAFTSLGAKITVDDLVLVGEDDDGDVELVTRSGAAVLVNPAYFRGATEPWRRFMSAVPPQIVRHKRGINELAAHAAQDEQPPH